jgi:Phage integrase family
MCACTERHDLQHGLALFRAVDEVPELLAHDFRAAYHPPDDRLVEDRPQPRPVLTTQDALAFHADLNEALYILTIEFTRAVAQRLPGVLRLEQARYHGARRQRPVRVPLRGRQASPAEQLRPTCVPPRLRRTTTARRRRPAPDRHRRRHHLARRPARRLASRAPERRRTERAGAVRSARGRGIRVIPDGVPLASWLPLVPSLTAHGLRHGHRTWMAEDGIPDILAEQRLGHEVPGMRGLYTHVSDRMRDQLVRALQARWEDSLRARAAIRPHSPVPLLDEVAGPAPPPPGGHRVRQRHRPAPHNPHHPREAGRS